MKTVLFTIYFLLALGTGLPEGGAVPILPLQFTPAALQFGVVTLGDDAGAPMVKLSLRDASGPFGPLRVQLGDPKHFSVVFDSCTGALLSGAMECQVAISFSPDVFGHYSSFLVILDEAGTLGNFVPLEGIGAESGYPGPPDPVADETTVSLSAGLLDFGRQTPGERSAGESVTLINTGSAELRVQATTFGGDAPFNFSRIDACAPALIPPGGTCAITVFFNPLSTDPAEAALAVSANVPENPLIVALAGNGAAPFPAPSGGGCGLAPAETPQGLAAAASLAYYLLVLAGIRRLK